MPQIASTSNRSPGSSAPLTVPLALISSTTVSWFLPAIPLPLQSNLSLLPLPANCTLHLCLLPFPSRSPFFFTSTPQRCTCLSVPIGRNRMHHHLLAQLTMMIVTGRAMVRGYRSGGSEWYICLHLPPKVVLLKLSTLPNPPQLMTCAPNEGNPEQPRKPECN